MKSWLTRAAGTLLLAAALLLGPVSQPAQATQNATSCPTTGTLSGLALVQCINNAFSTTVSQFSGASAPATPATWQVWADTTTNVLRIYNGTSWLPIGSFSGSQWVPFSNGVRPTAITTSGSANAYVLTYSPAPTALVTGQIYPAVASFANTASATLNINSTGAKNITKTNLTALAPGDIASGQVFLVVYDGSEFQMLSPPANNGGLIDVVYFTSSGTYNKNPAASFVEVTIVGGGGSGGSCPATSATQGAAAGGGGGGGASVLLIQNSALSATTTVTVGTGGAVAAAGANSGNGGGASSFGTFSSATGGAGGGAGSASTATGVNAANFPAPGGLGIGGDVNLAGQNGVPGMTFTNGTSVLSGAGGDSSLGGGGGRSSVGGTGGGGRSPGAGGAGGSALFSSGAQVGGAGVAGIVIVREYY